MIENFLRAPAGPADAIADLLRVAAALSVVFAAIWLLPTDAGILALTLPAVMLPRFIGARPGFDIVFSAVVLIAAWSNILDLYRTLAGWDKVFHLLCTAVIAPMVYLLLAHFEIVPRQGPKGVRTRVPVVLSATIGLAVSALWEMVEWVGFVVFTEEIFVEYHDTIGDMAAGGLGALLAGFVLARARLTRTPPAAEASESGSPWQSRLTRPRTPGRPPCGSRASTARALDASAVVPKRWTTHDSAQETQRFAHAPSSQSRSRTTPAPTTRSCRARS